MDEVTTSPCMQFSLLNLLLLTAVVALSITVIMLWSEVAPLRREVRRLRAEVGELDVKDETKPHAIQIETDSDLDWKWLVWIPESKRYVLRLATTEIPKAGSPPMTRHRIALTGPGEEFVIRYRIRRDPVDEKLSGQLTAMSRLAAHTGKELDWVDWDHRN